MKRPTPQLRKLHFIRARRQISRKRKKRLTQKNLYNYTPKGGVRVTVFRNGVIRKAISVGGPILKLPKVLSFRDNPQETIDFLSRLRTSLLEPEPNTVLRRTKGNHLPHIGQYYDFTTLETISTSCALILSAEYQRAWKNNQSPPSLINLQLWKPEVVNKLREIGFFKILNISERTLNRKTERIVDGNITTMKFFSGKNSEELEKADLQLLDLCEHIYPGEVLDDKIRTALTSAISEAMVNVRQHAYCDTHAFKFPHIGKFWFAGAADRKTSSITISMYDQGASIPMTYPHSNMVDKVKSHLKNLTSLGSLDEPNDGAYIATAVKYGNSQKGEPHRGKGLPQIKDAIDHCKNGTLMILSRAGSYVYNKGAKEQYTAFNGSVGGTLITWNVSIPNPEAT